MPYFETILYEGHGVQKHPLSRNIGDIEYDQHLAPTSSTRFHADQINLILRLIQVMTRKSSEVPRCWLNGSRDLMSKWIMKSGLNRDRCHWISMAERGTFLILLWLNILLNMRRQDDLVHTTVLSCAWA